MTIRVEAGITLTDLPIIFWDNVVSASSVHAESDPDFPASNVANPSTFLKWKHDIVGSPASATEYFTIDTSSSSPINYVAIAAHNYASDGIAIGLEIQNIDSPLGSGESLFEPRVPAGNEPIIFLFNTRETEGLRLIFTPTGSTPARMSVVYAGEYMEMEEGIQADHSPLPLSLINRSVNGLSENGQWLGRIILSSQLESSASFANMSKDWVRSDLVPFLEFASENPFFYAWSPLTYPDEVAYAWLSNDPVPIFDIDGYGAITLDMQGFW
jgi:hypothetical protein